MTRSVSQDEPPIRYRHYVDVVMKETQAIMEQLMVDAVIRVVSEIRYSFADDFILGTTSHRNSIASSAAVRMESRCHVDLSQTQRFAVTHPIKKGEISPRLSRSQSDPVFEDGVLSVHIQLIDAAMLGLCCIVIVDTERVATERGRSCWWTTCHSSTFRRRTRRQRC